MSTAASPNLGTLPTMGGVPAAKGLGYVLAVQLIQGRGRLLNTIHEKQRALDRLDFFIQHLKRGAEE